MKFFSVLKPRNVRRSSSSSWAWPSCHQPKTLSFRQYTTTTTTTNNQIKNKIKNKNDIIDDVVLEATESFFTESLHSASFSFSTVSEESRLGVDPIETVIRGLRSDRLFFEPDENSSILEVKLTNCSNYLPFKNSVVLSMDSKDPCADFRRSMAEMVETHGVQDWKTLEDLLCWYLKVNGKSNHGHIVNAFVDLLFEIANASSDEDDELSPLPSPSSEIYKSALSFSSGYCFDDQDDEDEITPEDEVSFSNT